MTLTHRWFSRIAMLVVAGAVLALAGCGGGNVRTDAAQAAIADHHFDATVKAYKNDQFLYDGAVLSALDLGSHFAYLKDQGKLPQVVLLENSDSTKIHKKHRQYMARLAIDYGFKVYYPDGDQLVRIEPNAKNARALEDATSRLPNVNRNQGQTAHDSTYGDVQQQEQREHAREH